MNNFIIRRCKRDEYIKAWREMYKREKEGFKNPIYDGINPALNKVPLKTEFDDYCVVCYDKGENESITPIPVGLFSFVCTPTKIIGKQYVVAPSYLRKGIGIAMLLVNEEQLIDNQYKWVNEEFQTGQLGKEKGLHSYHPQLENWYYIGCSSRSKGVYKKLGIEPYHSDVEGDLYKFKIRLDREEFDKQYKQYVIDKGFLVL